MKARICFLFLMTIVCCAAAAQTPASWQLFTSEEGRFTVRAPGKLVEDGVAKSGAGSKAASHSFTLTVGEDAYIATYTDFDSDLSTIPPDKLLNGARDGAVGNVHGKIVSEKLVTQNGFPGRDLVLSVPIAEKTGSARVLIVLAKNRLYVVLFITPHTIAGLTPAAEFLKSFKILGAQVADGWQNFTPADGRFTVRMPAAPTESLVDIEGGKLHRFILDHPGGAYIVSYNPIVAVHGPDEALLTAGRDGIVSTMKATVTEERPIKLGDFAGRSMRLTLPDGKSFAFVRSYVVGDRYYQVLVVADSRAVDSLKPEQFLDSFRITSPPKPGEWKQFHSEAEAFSVDLPGTPKREKLESGPIKYSVSAGEADYVVVAFDIGATVSDPDKVTALLDSVMKAEAKGLSAKPVERSRVPLGKASGLQVTLSVPPGVMPGGGQAFERFYLIGRRVYEVTTLTSDKKATPADFARFFDSFKAPAK